MSKKTIGLLLCIVTLLAFMLLAIDGRLRFPLINRGVLAVLSPINSVTQTFTGWGTAVNKKISSVTTLEADNEKLKRENAELRWANIKMAEFYAENQRLTRLLKYKDQSPEKQFLPAKVVGRNIGDLQDIVIINRGLNNGVEKDMAVVTGEGIVGLVEEVYSDAAKVKLIGSNRCKIGARILRAESRAVGVIRGRGAEQMPLEMEHLPREADVRKGDVVVTSGFSGNHPEGLVIGTVKETTLEAAGLLQMAEVESAVDSNKVEDVLLIISYKNPPPENNKISSNIKGGQAQ